MKKITLLILILFSSFAFSQDILMQNGTFNQCSGTFYDSGGPSANYSSNEDFTITICPDQGNSVTQLDFSAFAYSTQNNGEFLTIYDGDDTTAPVLGTYTGGGAAANPGFVTASDATINPTGCLTLTFTSNGSGNASGWGATISCFEPCQTITAVLDSTSPALNGDGNIEADLNETITFNGSGVFSGSGAGAIYTWDFGDGNTATGQTVTHTYATAGLYDVTLTITDTNPNGCQSTNNIDLVAIVGASSVGNPNVDAGDDLTVDCATGCVDLSASYLDIGLTNTYTVNEITFTPPFPFNGLTNSINTNVDDRWSPVEGLPFDFCFFGGVETQFQVGSNGVIRFDVDPSDTSNSYGFTENLPNNTNPTLAEANIFTPGHDINPAVNTTNEIRWEIIGTAPNRVLAVSFFEVPMFSCTTLEATHMAVMYETTNVIDIYIRDSPTCAFNSYSAVVGIQNDAGTTAFVPPGRNTSDSPWTTTNEAWRFTPAGPSVVTFAWLDAAGTVISTDPNFTVCPTVDTTYTAEVTYTNCNGDVVVVTDDVTVFVPFNVDLGADQNVCVGSPDVVLDATVTTTGATYQWTLDGADIAGETNPTLTVASPNSGTYGVSVTGAGCTVTDDVVITFSDSDPSFTMIASCTGGTVDTVATTGGVFSFNPAPTDTATIDTNTGEVTNGTPGATYTIEYNTLGACPGVTTQDLTILPADDATFTMVATCTGGTVDTIALPGGTFGFNPAPTDTAIIDVNTGEVTNVTLGATYTVEYTTNGTCPESSQFSLIIPALDDASFTVLATCDGAVIDTVATPGGVFALNPVPTDGTTIDAATGEVTGGASNTSYTIEYTTNGTCPDSSTESFVVNTTEDASFTMIATCDGGTVDSFATAGGTYAFNPLPTDAATIDATTGTVINGTSGVTYIVEYSFAGICSSSSTFDLTVLSVDDASITMTPTCDGGIVDSEVVPGGTYAFNPLPTDGAVIDATTGTVSGGQPDTTYGVEYTTNGACPATEIYSLTSYPLPTVVTPTVLGVCDDATPDGFTEIDLSIKNGEISGGNPNYSVTYYLTQADADAQVSPLPIPYTNISNPQTIYVNVRDVTTQCFDTTTLDLQVEDAPIAFTPSNLEYCDPDSDGFGVFTLTDAEAEINGGDNTLVVTYHETLADSENDVNALTSPYNNIVVNQQTIYVRIESPTISTNCASFVELVLIVNPTPEITDPTPLEVCDDNADGYAIFDLPTKNTEILNGLDPTLYTVTFYESEANALVPTNAIASPNAYVNIVQDMQTLWVRVENDATGCFSITTLDIIVNPLPVLTQPMPLTLCDYVTPNDGAEPFTLEDANAEVLGGLTGITLSYHLTQVGADTDTDEIFSPYVNTSNAQTIYIRAENNVTGCVSTITLDLRVTPTPSPVANPDPLEVCDTDNDGFAQFDIYSQSTIIQNGETGVTVTYHETLAEAEAGANALANFYNNIVANLQTIYVRVENTGVAPTPGTGCYTIVELDLVVLPSPVVPLDIPDYVICDTDDNGFAEFDFDTVITPQVYGTQAPADFILTYHTSQADADTGNAPIVNTANYTNTTTPQQTIYIRLESVANGCVTTGSFIIEVALPPVLNPTYDNTLSQCDDLDADYHENNDGFTAFDLTVEDSEIVNGNPSWIVEYYTTLADAQAGTNMIPDPTNYINEVMGPQTLFIRVTDADTGCFSFTTVTIRVLNNPSPGEDPADIILCDDNATGDMIEIFDLTVNETYIINGEDASNPIHLSYYTNEDDAVTGTNAIADPTQHSNEDPNNAGVAINPQTIYVRITNGDDVTGLNGTGCYSLEDFDLIVNPLPEVVPVSDYIICELNNDGAAQFDFSTKTDEILNGQDPSIFTVTYHETLVEAEQGINALTTLYTNITNPQEIFVNITNTVTGCDIATVSFNIEVQEAAQANPDLVPIVYEICDDEMDFDGDSTNNTAQFDLATQNEFVLDGQDPVSYTVSYYDNQADADAGTNALPFLYENTVNPQVIIVRVDNDTLVDDGTGTMVDSSQCFETAELTLQVNMLPSFDLDDTYLLCVNTNGTEAVNVPVIDTGLDATQYTFEWSYNGTVLPTETEPSLTPTQGGTYSVEVTDITSSGVTQCTSTDTTLVEESEPPVLSTEVTTLAFANEHAIDAVATGSGIAVYEFSIDGGPWEIGVLNADGAYSHTFNNVSAGEHVITVRDANGCGEASETVLVMDYPLYFTPNDDGYHDTWNIYGIDNQPDAKIFIFDRFGKLLKQLSPTGAGWDGTYNGNPMPTSDYWFTVDYREPGTDNKKSFKAHFTLKR